MRSGSTPRRRWKQGLFTRTNAGITVPEIRLIGAGGAQLGIVKTEDARKQARDLGVDLVEIAPNAKPPIAKLIDFQRYRYELAKRARTIRKKTHEVEVKEIRLGPFISDHDLATRMRQANEFLDHGDRIRFVVKFKGRQMERREYGKIVMDRVLERIGDRVEVQGEGRFEGRRFATLIAPVKKGRKKSEKEQSQEQKIHPEAHPYHQNGQTLAPQGRAEPPQDGQEQTTKAPDARPRGSGKGG